MVTWHAISSAVYYAADPGTLSDDSLYFLTDTKELYRGATSFTEAVVLYTQDSELPATPARKKLYVNTTTGEGRVYTGSAWQTVIKPIASEIVTDGVNPVNSKAVIKYVEETIGSSDAIVSDVTYVKGGVKLNVAKGDGTSKDLVLEGLGVSLDYDAGTGALTLKDVNGAVLGSAINLDLERFVKAAEYDADNKKIFLYFDDAKTDKIEIPVGDLVDTYTAKDTSSVHLTVTSNQFAAEVIVSTAEGNQLQKTENGLFVAATDLSSYMKLVTSANTGLVPMLNAAGQVVNGTHALGGAALAESPTANVLATELAVSALVNSVKTELVAELNKKMALVATPDTTKVPMLDGNGQIVNGTYGMGGAALAADPSDKTLATEKAVRAAIDAEVADVLREGDIATSLSASSTDDQVVSAKAAYDALTWKTTL